MVLDDFKNGSSWLELLEEQAKIRELSVNIYPEDSRSDYNIENKVLGKIRRSRSKDRDDPYIWLRFDTELNMIEEYENKKIFAVVFDYYSDGSFNPQKDHFIPITHKMLLTETSKNGNRKFEVYSKGQYEEPFGSVVDDWDTVFKHFPFYS